MNSDPQLSTVDPQLAQRQRLDCEAANRFLIETTILVLDRY
jgi:hypothetical protein